MPVVTQTRELTQPYSRVQYASRPVWSSTFTDMSGLPAPTQTTTGFRTGRQWDPVSDDIPDSENQLAFAKWLRKNEKDQNWANRYDTGHEFVTKKTEVFLSHEKVPFVHPYYGSMGYGPIAPSFYGVTDGYWADPSEPDLGWYGPTAFKRAKPTSPHEDLAVALAELRSEGIPEGIGSSTWQARTNAARIAQATGKDWLAYQFGWLPLIGDMRKTADAIKHSREYLEQFHRDAGKPIRRSVTFPAVESHKHLRSGSGYLLRAAPSTEWDQCFVNSDLSGQYSLHQHDYSRVWFTGCFSYASSTDESAIGKLKRLEQDVNHLFGSRLTPEVVWNLTPWSWLSDWTNSIGTNISNASALQSDGLVLRYGYLMSTSIRDRVMTVTGPRLNGGLTGPYAATLRTTVKRRTKATPYGFGLNPNAFTARQWSILGALGLSRSPGVFQ